MTLDTTGATRSAIDQLLKEHYLGPIREQLNSEALLDRRVERNTENVDGRQVNIPLHTGRTRAIQAALEGGLLPTAQSQTYTTMTFPVGYNYGVIRVHGPAMASSRTNLGAFIRVLDQEIRGMVRDIKNDRNRQQFGDGSGRLAICTGASAGAVIPVQQVWDSGNQASAFKHIYPNDRLALEDVSTTGTAVALTGTGNYALVSSVDYKGKTVTMTATVTATTAAGDALFKGPDENTAITAWADDSNFRGIDLGTPNTAKTKKELMGLVGIINGPNGFPKDGASAYSAMWQAGVGSTYAGSDLGVAVAAPLQGIAGDTTWAANMSFNAGVPRPLTLDLMQQTFDECEEIGQATPTILLTSYAVRRKYLDLLVPDRRYTGANTYELDGGFRAVDYNDVPMVVDKDCPEATIMMLSEPNLAIYRTADWHWLDKDGAILSRVVGRDAWEAILAEYSEFATDRRNAHGALGDIAI